MEAITYVEGACSKEYAKKTAIIAQTPLQKEANSKDVKVHKQNTILRYNKLACSPFY